MKRGGEDLQALFGPFDVDSVGGGHSRWPGRGRREVLITGGNRGDDEPFS